MIKKQEIFKYDKWNMMHVEVHGKTLIVREISDQWGEESYTFISRPEMMNWVMNRFTAEKYPDNEAERQRIIQCFKEI